MVALERQTAALVLCTKVRRSDEGAVMTPYCHSGSSKVAMAAAKSPWQYKVSDVSISLTERRYKHKARFYQVNPKKDADAEIVLQTY